MKKYLLIISLFFLTACNTIEKTKYIDVIVEKEIEKKYILPDFQNCEKKPILENGTITELRDKYLEIDIAYKNCEKIKLDYEKWIKRNFGEK